MPTLGIVESSPCWLSQVKSILGQVKSSLPWVMLT